MLLSAGERISMALLSMAIRELGGDAISFTGSQSGIITNDRHVDARIIEVRPFRVQDELARGKIVVIAGYQGVSYRKEVTTLGRGGSDTTAVAMAAALGAECCEICSDVDGVYSADPRVVPRATHRHALLRGNAGDGGVGRQGLERAGRRIRERTGIAIYARATAAALPGADPSADGTVVRKLPPRMPGTVVGVASESDLLLLRASGQGLRLLAFLDDHHVAGKQLHVLTGQGGGDDQVSLVVSRENLHDEDRVRAQLATAFGERATLVDGFGAVSAIGAGINMSYDNLRAGTRALEAAGLSTYDIATSSFRITWFVERTRLNDATRALHAAFIESQTPSVP